METSSGTSLIPTDAYLYFPEEKEKFAGEGKKLIRFIFEGETTFQKFENDSLDQLYVEFEKQKVPIPENWRRSDSLKFLIACSFDFNKAIKGITEYIEWRKAILPIQLTSTIEEYLRSGIIYMHGRDHRFKPIIVLKCYKVDPKTLDIDQFLLTLGYFLEYLIANTLLPGQAERWVFIQDLKGMGISSIPFTALKRILGFLQNNFRSRLSKMYIMNSPSTLYFSWKMVKPLLEETTTAKINFSKDSLNEDMWKHINKSQVEARFGGTAKDTENGYWPPVVVSNDYFVEGDDPKAILVSQETYKKMHSEGKLEKYTVHKDLIN